MPAGRILKADSTGASAIIPETAIMVEAKEALHAEDTAAEILAEILTAVHAEVLMARDLARGVHLTALHGPDHGR